MRIAFTPRGWSDYRWWAGEDRNSSERIERLIEETRRSPFKGLGKPEPLKGDLSGWWSRRIDDEHRMVYRVVGKGEDQTLEIVQLRFHYR